MRQRFALLTPAIWACLFALLLTRRDFGDALPGAVGAGLGVLVIFNLGMVATTQFAAWLQGIRADSREDLREYLAGALLATLVWAWWQYDRDRTVERVARCVGDRAGGQYATGVSPRTLVWACYDEPADDGMVEDE
jgi:hypothetical protein